MNFIFAKLLSIPLLQTGKTFSEIYPEGEKWILEFLEKGIEPGDARRLRENGEWNKEHLNYTVEHHLTPDFRCGIRYFLLYKFAGWIEKDKEKVEIVKRRLNTYFTFELNYDEWKWTSETMPKTPEEALDWFEEAGI